MAPDENPLVKETLLLFNSLLTKQNVAVEGKTLTVASEWVVRCLKGKPPELITSGLLVLQALVRGKASQLPDCAEAIVQMCRQFMVEYVGEEPPLIYLNSLHCVESLVYCEEEGETPPESTVDKCCQIFISLFYETPSLKSPLWQCKCLISGLHGLGNLAGSSGQLLNSSLAEVFGVVKGYMLYGVPGQDSYKVEKIIPSNIALPEQLKAAQPVKKSMGKYDRKSKKKVLTPISNVANDDDERGTTNGYVGTSENQETRLSLDVTSDSDFSDGEGGTAGQLRRLQSKVIFPVLPIYPPEEGNIIWIFFRSRVWNKVILTAYFLESIVQREYNLLSMRY